MDDATIWYVTKYWATRGIEARSNGRPNEGYVYFRHTQCKIGRDAFLTRGEAVDDVVKKARKRILLLNRAITNVQHLLRELGE